MSPAEGSLFRRKGISNEDAVQRAIDECIERGILRDVLSKEKSDAMLRSAKIL